MTALLLAEFSNEKHFIEAARRVRAGRYRLLDAFTPFPVEDVNELLEQHHSHIRLAMFIGGITMAAIAYGTEYYSAAIDYPYNSGGRPFDAWPAFMLVPFATGILVAALAGFAMFLFETGLPRLHDPLFALEGFDRASQDCFVLALERPSADEDHRLIVEMLRNVGAAAIRETEL
jgi:hypothetical protein